MKVFLTGGSGGIGLAIRKKLVENGIEVIFPSHHELDLSYSFYRRIKVDGFIHCAGIHNYGDIMRVNATSFVSLCDQLQISDGETL